ncbi:hypothetical protein LCGC14_1510110 [marine sediment metagenome]|uniref:Uncharacterized protein n=1 Tax=marine sediment metagenome TaxID=412755 RepID=A0A0F9JMC1_9ZZZZ
MKPLSEFEKDLRADGKGLSGDAFLVNRANCDLLQAWLREADAWLRKAELHTGELQYIRRELLGTTRTEGEK